MHSGILKNSGEKSYQSYLSNDHKHDQVFVHLAVEEMLKKSEINPDMHIIENGNCSQQYKSAPYFYHLLELANKYHTKII